MSKGLNQFPENERMRIAMRRTNNPKEKGNGYWGAMDYLAKFGGRKAKKSKKADAFEFKVMNNKKVAILDNSAVS